MSFSSSYSPEVLELITLLVRFVNPQVSLEIGSQQGTSGNTIGKGMKVGSFLYLYDLFKSHYDAPPYSSTHASIQKCINTVKDLDCSVLVQSGSALEAIKYIKEQNQTIDLLHIDICNHYDNLFECLAVFFQDNTWLIQKMIILEGGILNQWQRDYSFQPYQSLLNEDWIADYWTSLTLPFNNHNAITILTKK